MPDDDDLDTRAIGGPERIRLLASPVRQELVDTLVALGGEASVGALAEQLGRPADGLYYHLRLLKRGRLVSEIPAPPGEEMRYRLAGDGSPLRLAYTHKSDDTDAALVKFARNLLQIARREFEQGLGTPGVVAEGPRRELWVSRNKGWVSPEELEEVNALLERLSELTSHPRGPGRGRLMSLAFVLAPVSPRPKRR